MNWPKYTLLGLLLGSLTLWFVLLFTNVTRVVDEQIPGTFNWPIFQTADRWTATPAPPYPPPSHVKVGPYSYSIHFGVSPVNMGETFLDEREIWLSTKFPLSQNRETMLHELMHACIDIGHHPRDAKTSSDDEIIEAIAPTLIQVMQDNPELVKWLRSVESGDVSSKSTGKSADSATTILEGTKYNVTVK